MPGPSPTPAPNLVRLAEALTTELCERFPLGYRPKLLWKVRLRVTAGMAYYRDQAIGLSPWLLDTEERLIGTLKHEYAHLLAYARHGRKGAGHGAPWREAMLELGQKPEVHHRYEVQRNKSHRTVIYLCKKCGTQITRKRRLPANRKYLHVGCGGTIALQAVQGREAE